MLIFASISFLLLPTLTIQQGHLLMQIKYAFTYPLGGISMICQDFYKLRILFDFCACLFFAQFWWGFLPIGGQGG
ncbi:hypothetical protein EKN59_20580 [Enterobacter hormaechei]|nr:hypothetical protein EQ802_21705 [Enterobacter hormaechei]RTN49194.1 hypothetical protein EKN91_19495 [Enterobacter hormaechei]RTO77280.1 hypothetical protein EKN59_20580 [Enterobacter hormaechei]TXV48805.1 hypothetical protein D4M82_20450 [Enterobacter hormaechei]TXW32561.1 hypothetical protein D4M51_17350 [Enterobacter hormaechei]